jgi:hypothetical protein
MSQAQVQFEQSIHIMLVIKVLTENMTNERNLHTSI